MKGCAVLATTSANWGGQEVPRIAAECLGDLGPYPVRRDRQGLRYAVDVGQQVAQDTAGFGRTVPDEVKPAAAAFHRLVQAGHGVAQHLLAVGQRKGEMVAKRVLRVRRQLGLVHQTAPRDIADIGWLNVGSEPGADGREDAVGADQQIALFGCSVAEMGCDRGVGFLDAVEVPALMVAGVGQSCAEQAVEVTPGSQDLPERQFADDRAVAAEDAPAGDRDADLSRLTVDTGALQHVEQFRVGHDAGAPAGQLGADPLEDIGLPAGAAEQECREEAGHRAADDDGSRLPSGSRFQGGA